MPALKTYDLFISHAWDYNDEYYRLVDFLEQAPYFSWRNYSVPEHDRLVANNATALTNALRQQIRPVNCVLILAGMYVNHRDWIQKEIELAASFGKPVVGVVPWAQQVTPVAVSSTAREMVRWNTDSIVAAVRRHSI